MRRGPGNLPEILWHRIDEGQEWPSHDARRVLIREVIQQRLVAVDDEDVDGAVDLGDYASVEREHKRRRRAAHHHLTGQSLEETLC